MEHTHWNITEWNPGGMIMALGPPEGKQRTEPEVIRAIVTEDSPYLPRRQRGGKGAPSAWTSGQGGSPNAGKTSRCATRWRRPAPPLASSGGRVFAYTC